MTHRSERRAEQPTRRVIRRKANLEPRTFHLLLATEVEVEVPEFIPVWPAPPSAQEMSSQRSTREGQAGRLNRWISQTTASSAGSPVCAPNHQKGDDAQRCLRAGRPSWMPDEDEGRHGWMQRTIMARCSAGWARRADMEWGWLAGRWQLRAPANGVGGKGRCRCRLLGTYHCIPAAAVAVVLSAGMLRRE